MKTRRFAVAAVTCSACVAGLLFPPGGFAQEVKLENVSFEQVLTELFGTEEIPGLLNGERTFQLHADGVILTREEAASFFAASSAERADFSDLITGAEQGTDLEIKGLLDGSPFELKLSGKQVKLDGVNLTRSDFDALVEELKGSPGPRESRIDATVEGRPVIVRIENTPERVRVEGLGGTRALTVNGSENVEAERLERRDLPERVNVDLIKRPARARTIERPEPIRVERVEPLRVEKPVKVEKPERPDRRGRDRDD